MDCRHGWRCGSTSSSPSSCCRSSCRSSSCCSSPRLAEDGGSRRSWPSGSGCRRCCWKRCCATARASSWAHYHLAYSIGLQHGMVVIGLYIVATCGSLLASGFRHIVVFGCGQPRRRRHLGPAERRWVRLVVVLLCGHRLRCDPVAHALCQAPQSHAIRDQLRDIAPPPSCRSTQVLSLALLGGRFGADRRQSHSEGRARIIVLCIVGHSASKEVARTSSRILQTSHGKP